MRVRTAIPVIVTLAALVAAGVASASTSSYSDGPLTATFTAGTHHPNCKQGWPVTVTARYQGKPAHATAFYQFLSGGQLVDTQYPFSGTSRNPHKHLWAFYGSFTDNTFGPFGALAIGHPLTVRAVVQVSRYTAYPSYSIDVVNASGCPAK
ncbi:MAG: hypothetical protein ABSH51_02745 [Solirubrobacteraceae bacterium]|jgi:hypothetical protein